MGCYISVLPMSARRDVPSQNRNAKVKPSKRMMPMMSTLTYSQSMRVVTGTLVWQCRCKSWALCRLLLNQMEKRSPKTGMAPTTILMAIFNDILKMTIRGTPAFVAKKRSDDPMALLIGSPMPGISPKSGPKPHLTVVPGMVKDASSKRPNVWAS